MNLELSSFIEVRMQINPEISCWVL